MSQDVVDPPDWKRIELDFRAGILSLRDIAKAHPGTNHVAIARRAKKDGWTRDLRARIQARAEELVTRQAVTPTVTPEQTVSESLIVETNAVMQASVRREHRQDIQRARVLTMSLLSELEGVTHGAELFEKLGELMAAPDENGIDKLNEVYRKVISMTGRVGNMKSLAEALQRLVAMEREAFGIDDKRGGSQRAGDIIIQY